MGGATAEGFALPLIIGGSVLSFALTAPIGHTPSEHELPDDASLIFFSSRRRHTRLQGDWNSDVCSSDLTIRACWAHTCGTTSANCRRGHRSGNHARLTDPRTLVSGPLLDWERWRHTHPPAVLKSSVYRSGPSTTTRKSTRSSTKVLSATWGLWWTASPT